ncbi:MAG: hypothetical protein ACO35Q_08195 [Prochlorothrix sp.]
MSEADVNRRLRDGNASSPDSSERPDWVLELDLESSPQASPAIPQPQPPHRGESGPADRSAPTVPAAERSPAASPTPAPPQPIPPAPSAPKPAAPAPATTIEVTATPLPTTAVHPIPSAESGLGPDLAQLQQENRELRDQNQDLQDWVTELERSFQDCQASLQHQLECARYQEQLVQDRNQELLDYHHRLETLNRNLEAAQQAAHRHKILAETLSNQLESSQDRITQMERECGLTQKRFAEQTQRLVEMENECRDLKTRLSRQQRYTLQFKAALEKCLDVSVPNPGAPDLSNFASLSVPSSLEGITQAMDFFPRSQPVQPWSSQAGSDLGTEGGDWDKINHWLAEEPALVEAEGTQADELDLSNLSNLSNLADLSDPPSPRAVPDAVPPSAPPSQTAALDPALTIATPVAPIQPPVTQPSVIQPPAVQPPVMQPEAQPPAVQQSAYQPPAPTLPQVPPPASNLILEHSAEPEVDLQLEQKLNAVFGSAMGDELDEMPPMTAAPMVPPERPGNMTIDTVAIAQPSTEQLGERPPAVASPMAASPSPAIPNPAIPSPAIPSPGTEVALGFGHGPVGVARSGGEGLDSSGEGVANPYQLWQDLAKAQRSNTEQSAANLVPPPEAGTVPEIPPLAESDDRAGSVAAQMDPANLPPTSSKTGGSVVMFPLPSATPVATVAEAAEAGDRSGDSLESAAIGAAYADRSPQDGPDRPPSPDTSPQTGPQGATPPSPPWKLGYTKPTNRAESRAGLGLAASAVRRDGEGNADPEIDTPPVQSPASTPTPAPAFALALPSTNWPSPLVHPLRPSKKRESLAAVELPSFPKAP